MSYELPVSLEVNGKERPIRTDFRVIMKVIFALNDPDLKDEEKAYVCLYDIFEDFEEIDKNDYGAAFKAASDFIDYGMSSGGSGKHGSDKSVVSFEQDERLLISAINRVAGKEVRALDYLHWWTFMSYFMEIGECTYSTVLSIRSKKNKGKKLEKWEQEFFDSNKDICVIQGKLSEEEIESKKRIQDLLG